MHAQELLHLLGQGKLTLRGHAGFREVLPGHAESMQGFPYERVQGNKEVRNMNRNALDHQMPEGTLVTREGETWKAELANDSAGLSPVV